MPTTNHWTIRTRLADHHSIAIHPPTGREVRVNECQLWGWLHGYPDSFDRACEQAYQLQDEIQPTG